MSRHLLAAACAVLAVLLISCGTEEERLAARGRTFVEAVARRDLKRACRVYHPVLCRDTPAKDLSRFWSMALRQVGPFECVQTCRTLAPLPVASVVVRCTFRKRLVDVRLTMNERMQVTSLFYSAVYTTPAYADRRAFAERKVTVGSGIWALPGTLSMPKGRGPFPAAVLVHGSGPSDRDENIIASRPFRDIAWGLASRGIAVLRYDKRMQAYQITSQIQADHLTVKEETIDDALQAVSLLRRMRGIRPDRVFVIGHSLGGMLAPRIGKADPRIAGLVSLAGPSRPLEDIVVDQTMHLAKAGDRFEKEDVEWTKEEAACVKRLDFDLDGAPMGLPESYWRDLHGYRPATMAAALKQPMLILQGGRDYQVTTTDLRGWQKALAHRPDARFRLYPKLNHVFCEGGVPSVPEEYMFGGNVDAAVIEDIATWISDVARVGGRDHVR